MCVWTADGIETATCPVINNVTNVIIGRVNARNVTTDTGDICVKIYVLQIALVNVTNLTELAMNASLELGEVIAKTNANHTAIYTATRIMGHVNTAHPVTMDQSVT